MFALRTETVSVRLSQLVCRAKKWASENSRYVSRGAPEEL